VFFHSWSDIGRVVAISALAFLIIVTLLRIVGPQSLAKMSGFDVVFTVTMGSVIATVVVSREVALLDGVAALVTMLALQEIIRRFQSRFLPVHHLVRQAPRVLLWDGTLLEDRLQGSGVSADEIRAAVRKAGLRSLADVLIVVLENDGEWSVIAKSAQRSDESALFGLPIPGRPGQSPTHGSATAMPAPVNRLP
jgi:uncharacterized membrane protein YcaP (DUF421 family)